MDIKHRTPRRVTIIPNIHGKITRDGKISEPDIHWIIEKWLDRHPQIKKRSKDIRVVRGVMTLPQGVKTELISATIISASDIEGYDPKQDEDLYAYFLSTQRSDDVP
jgi:hypothetical protein